MEKLKKACQKLGEYFYEDFWKENRALMVVLLATLTLVAVVRVRYLAVPLDRDEGEYAYMGQLILQGYLPYEQAYNLKLPGTHFVFALIMLLLGQSHVAIHFGFLLINVAAAFFLLLFLKNIAGTRISIIAATFFLLMSISYALQGIFARAENLVVFLSLAGLWVLSEAFRRNKTRSFFWGGVLLALAFLMKQHGIFLTLFGLIYVIWKIYLGWKQKTVSQRETRNRLVFYAAGSVFPLLVLVFVYLAKGELSLLWYWSFAYAKEHLSIMTFQFGLEYLRNNFFLITAIHPFQIILLFIGTLVAIFRIKKNENWLFLSFAALSFLCVVPGFYFSKYYFAMFLPGLCLLAAVGAVFLADKFFDKENSKKILLIIVLVTVSYPVIRQSDYLFSYSHERACRMIFGSNPYPEALVIADYLKKNTDPADKIAVLGSEPEIFFYTKRKSATGFIYMYSLMDDHKYADQMQNQMILEMEDSNPKYVVFAGMDTSWRHSRHTGDIILNWYPGFLKENYEMVGVVDSYAIDKTEYVWGEQAAEYKIKSKNIVWIYKRKDI